MTAGAVARAPDDRTVGGRGPWWNRVIVLFTLASCFFIVARAAADPDLFGHIRFGQEILDDGGLPTFDRYAYTSEGYPWINHEVGAEITFAVLYDTLGNSGLQALRLLIAFSILALLYRHSMRSGLDPLRSGVLMVLAALLVVNGTVTVRPQLFTFVFLLGLLLVLERAERERSRIVWLVPLILMAWINFHGGALAGLALVGVWMGGRWLEWLLGRDYESKEALGPPLTATAVFAASPLAMLLNPYGWDLLHFLITTATVPRPDITEWAPTPMDSRRGRVYLALVVMSLMSLHWTRARKHVPLLCLFGAVAVLPLMAVRHIPLFGIAIAILMPVHFASASKRLAESLSDSPEPPAAFRPMMLGITALSAIMLIAAAIPDTRCVRIDPRRASVYPVRAVEWIRQSGVEGRLATFFDWGEYAIWHLEPGIRVGMDGRRETVYPDSIREEYLAFQNGLANWQDHIDKRGAEMALVPVYRPMYSLMKLKPGWELLYDDSLAAVFAPTGSTHAARLSSTPVPEVSVNGVGMCAP